jgi:hypothetical protein
VAYLSLNQPLTFPRMSSRRQPPRSVRGSGPPARLLITWIIATDPHLRSALEYATVAASCTRHRVSTLRRNLTYLTTLVVLLASILLRVWRLVL